MQSPKHWPPLRARPLARAQRRPQSVSIALSTRSTLLCSRASRSAILPLSINPETTSCSFAASFEYADALPLAGAVARLARAVGEGLRFYVTR